MKRIILLSLAVAGLAMADHIPLDRLKSVQGLPLDTRMLINKLANFQLTKAEAGVLAAKPGAADAIIELSEIVEEFEHLSDVFGVLRMRSDLTDTQQRRIRDVLNPLVGNMKDGRASVVKQQGLYLIGQYTSEANEALLIRFLSERKHWRDSDFSDVAAEGLARMGSPKALEALKQYAARAKPPEGYQSRGYNAAVEAEKQILARSSAGTDSTLSKSSAIKATASKPAKSSNEQAATPNEEPTSSTPWSVMVVSIASALGLLWLLVKKRK